MSEPAKSVLDVLREPDEVARVQAVADLMFQSESYVRLLSQSLAGLAERLANDADALRDLHAIRAYASEIAQWMASHHEPLYVHVAQCIDLAGLVAQQQESAQAAAPTPDSQTIH